MELKPCPFCGGNNISMKDDRPIGKRVQCEDCGGMMVYYYNLPVNEEWNTRADTDLLRRVKEAVGEMENYPFRDVPVEQVKRLMKNTFQELED